MKIKKYLIILGVCLTLASCQFKQQTVNAEAIDYVNPYIGNISHLLVPTFPTIHLPNSMLRVYPERSDYTAEKLNGLPVIVTNHRERSAFNLSPYQGNILRPIIPLNYDNEHITPFGFDVELDDNRIKVEYALSHHSAIYQLTFTENDPAHIIVNSRNGSIRIGDNFISGIQKLSDNTNVYLYVEPEIAPLISGILDENVIDNSKNFISGINACGIWKFDEGIRTIRLRYGISFISEEQAKKNLRSEIVDYDLQKLQERGRAIWNESLGKIEITGGTEDERTVFYTSLYRTFERPICMSEVGGVYFSAFDGKVHKDNGVPFYTDDWIWDTYRAAHPLRTLIDIKKEEDIIASYLLMAEQMGNMWMPTFPEVTGDTRRMNSNHAVATVADAISKGMNLDMHKAYEACRKGIEEKTLAPWSGNSAGWIDRFYRDNGYIPALQFGEKENDPNVHSFEKRQPVAVTLGTSYDQWCLSKIAKALGKDDEAAYFLKCSYNYRKLFNKETGFFHPKDKNGNWIQPFDYRYSGGMGAREYYGENNGWVYRWDVPHNIADLIELMGGNEDFIKNLDQTFSEPLGKSKFEFYSQLPDHTGNVGQFSMANEPSLHIPYLYNYAGQPWKTQKRIRQMLKTWFRNDLMGVPGDEDGSGMTSFVVFSSLGIYPVTPGLPIYNIGSPLFTYSKINLENGQTFEIEARNVSAENKYIQSAKLNGVLWDKPWISHYDIINGGKLVFIMGDKPNKQWGANLTNTPPSAE